MSDEQRIADEMAADAQRVADVAQANGSPPPPPDPGPDEADTPERSERELRARTTILEERVDGHGQVIALVTIATLALCVVVTVLILRGARSPSP